MLEVATSTLVALAIRATVSACLQLARAVAVVATARWIVRVRTGERAGAAGDVPLRPAYPRLRCNWHGLHSCAIWTIPRRMR